VSVIASNDAEKANDDQQNMSTNMTSKLLLGEWLDDHPEIRNAGLSQAAVERLFEMSQSHVPHDRPSWDETFLQIACDIAKRSPDAQTPVGAVIVDTNKHIMSVGYNGWMPGIDDDLIPNVRPHKHDWVIHAELNALLNCEVRPRGATLYCTHQPCLPCFYDCVAARIGELVYIRDSSTTNTQDKDVDWEVALFLTRKRIKVRSVEFSWNG
jgi:dCMP deaminase